MAKSLNDILRGVKSSKKIAATLGKNPGVDYKPRSGDEADFAASHSIEKHEDRVGNTDDLFNASNIKRTSPFGKTVKEAMEKEDAKCNMSEAGKMCAIHGKEDCSKKKTITEDDVPLPPARPKDLDKVPTPPERPKNTKKKDDETQGGQLAKTGMRTFEEFEIEEANKKDNSPEHKANVKALFDTAKKIADKDKDRKKDADDHDAWREKRSAAVKGRHYHEEVEVNEVLTKKTPAATWIKDFVNSKNPKFAGKSKEERTKQALGAYYSKQRNEEVEPIEEVSKEKLAAYSAKAGDTSNVKDEGQRKSYNRLKGMGMAYSKSNPDKAQTKPKVVATEEVDLDEAEKAKTTVIGIKTGMDYDHPDVDPANKDDKVVSIKKKLRTDLDEAHDTPRHETDLFHEKRDSKSTKMSEWPMKKLHSHIVTETEFAKDAKEERARRLRAGEHVLGHRKPPVKKN
jgi:hypothetical protein